MVRIRNSFAHEAPESAEAWLNMLLIAEGNLSPDNHFIKFIRGLDLSPIFEVGNENEYERDT